MATHHKEGNYKILWDAYINQNGSRLIIYTEFPVFDNPVLFLIMAFVCLLAGLLLYGILRKKLSLRIDRHFYICLFVLTPFFW